MNELFRAIIGKGGRIKPAQRMFDNLGITTGDELVIKVRGTKITGYGAKKAASPAKKPKKGIAKISKEAVKRIRK